MFYNIFNFQEQVQWPVCSHHHGLHRELGLGFHGIHAGASEGRERYRNRLVQSKRVLCTLLLPGKEMYLAFVSQAIVGGLLL